MSNRPQENDDINRQRNEMALLLARIAIERGWDAGWGEDDNENWDAKWRTVIYIDLPTGQVCWHMDPARAHTAKTVLPKYDGDWDGKWYDMHSQRIIEYLNRAA